MYFISTAKNNKKFEKMKWKMLDHTYYNNKKACHRDITIVTLKYEGVLHSGQLKQNSRNEYSKSYPCTLNWTHFSWLKQNSKLTNTHGRNKYIRKK